MSWNYRIVKYRDGNGFGLHEVQYDKEGLPFSMTEEPASFVAALEEGPQGIHQSMMMARTDAIRRPIFEEPEEGKWPGKAPHYEASKV